MRSRLPLDLAGVRGEDARRAPWGGDRPELVVLGGLVPQLLCSGAGVAHAGTTDIDVQVDLEIAGALVNTGRLEQALRTAEFAPDQELMWPRLRTASALS